MYTCLKMLNKLLIKSEGQGWNHLVQNEGMDFVLMSTAAPFIYQFDLQRIKYYWLGNRENKHTSQHNVD